MLLQVRFINWSLNIIIMIYQNIRNGLWICVKRFIGNTLPILCCLVSCIFISLESLANSTYPFESMCTNVRWIKNRYIDQKILVSCGHCKACRQEKANKRATRLKNEMNDSIIALFVSLTYDRFSVPYIRQEDISVFSDSLPIYRDCVIRRDPVSHSFKRIHKRTVIGYGECIDYNYDLSNLVPVRIKVGNHFKYDYGKYGVCLFSDVQDFNKRLRQNLKRKFHCNEKYKVFNVFEYGETTFRPHVHLLMYIPKDLYQVFRTAIVESWPFADRKRTFDNVQIARDASSYVASYVNSPTELPLFIEKNFPPKYSFSQGLGCGRDSFQLDQILKNVDRGFMSYNLQTSRDGVPCVVNLPIPKYVINRYFPLFKGYSRLSSEEIFDLLSSVERCSKIYDKLYKIDDSRRRVDLHFEYYFRKRNSVIGWTIEDMFVIGTRLYNSYQRYKRLTGKSVIDFAIDFRNTWSCYKNTIYKRFALDPEPLQYKYDNLLSVEDLVTPNRLSHSMRLSDLYDKKCKSRYVNNATFAQSRYDV